MCVILQIFSNFTEEPAASLSRVGLHPDNEGSNVGTHVLDYTALHPIIPYFFIFTEIVTKRTGIKCTVNVLICDIQKNIL